ncbi:MAG: acyl-CoA thioesterase [Bacteroidota bacterium]
MTFTEHIKIRWADIDHNQHVRHSAYYDYGAQCRISFFQANGFDMAYFAQHHIGPILFSEQCNFLRELTLGETVAINLRAGSLSGDGTKWTLYHELFKESGEKAAHLKVTGAWMNTALRKITAPPEGMAKAMHGLAAGEEFVFRK